VRKLGGIFSYRRASFFIVTAVNTPNITFFTLLFLGVLNGINQFVDHLMLELVASEFDHCLEIYTLSALQ
jgi:hypothetical protein